MLERCRLCSLIHSTTLTCAANSRRLAFLANKAPAVTIPAEQDDTQPSQATRSRRRDALQSVDERNRAVKQAYRRNLAQAAHA